MLLSLAILEQKSIKCNMRNITGVILVIRVAESALCFAAEVGTIASCIVSFRASPRLTTSRCRRCAADQRLLNPYRILKIVHSFLLKISSIQVKGR